MVNNKETQNALQKLKWKWWWQWTMRRHKLQGKSENGLNCESESDDYKNCTFPIQPQQLFSRQIWHPGSNHQSILFDKIKLPNSSFSFHLWMGDWLPYCSANDCNQCYRNVEYPIISSFDQNHLDRQKELESQKRYTLAWTPGKAKIIFGEQKLPFLAHSFSLTKTFLFFSPLFFWLFFGGLFFGPA